HRRRLRLAVGNRAYEPLELLLASGERDPMRRQTDVRALANDMAGRRQLVDKGVDETRVGSNAGSLEDCRDASPRRRQIGSFEKRVRLVKRHERSEKRA